MRDAPQCGLLDCIGDARRQVEAVGWVVCVAVNEHLVVLGMLRRRELDAKHEATAEQVVRFGPAIYRPDALVSDVVEPLRQRRVTGFLVTRPDGTLNCRHRQSTEDRQSVHDQLSFTKSRLIRSRVASRTGR